MRIYAMLLTAASLFGAAETAWSFEPLDGTFIAKRACAAPASIRGGNNPGKVRVVKDEAYTVKGLNKPKGTFVQIRVDGAKPDLRWVALNCGDISQAEPNPPPTMPGDGTPRYVLALSWQSAFCESKPDKTECRSQTQSRFDASHFAIHGLWPQPESRQYCDVSPQDRTASEKRRWEALPEPAISVETRSRLEIAMPGTASFLERHEYTKHGTCFGANAESYFRSTLALTDQINASKLRDAVAGKVGQSVTAQQLEQAFDQSFGAGTSKALEINCQGDIDSRRVLLSEIRINLKGQVTDKSQLADVLDTEASRQRDCAEAIVDPVGLQ